MYALTGLALGLGAMSLFAAVVLLAAPRALAGAAGDVPSRRRRSRRPGYVGWPLWYHRVCLVHNRAFGWLYIAGLAVGAIWPASVLG